MKMSALPALETNIFLVELQEENIKIVNTKKPIILIIYFWLFYRPFFLLCQYINKYLTQYTMYPPSSASKYIYSNSIVTPKPLLSYDPAINCS